MNIMNNSSQHESVKRGWGEKICPVYNQFSLASIVTVFGTIMGLIGVLSALEGNYSITIVCIHIAIICDSVDGMIARKTNKASEFGEQLDSLSDFFNFVMGPCIIGFSLGFTGTWSMIAYVVFLAGGISRLALFNISSDSYKKGKKVFVGIPVPMATALLYCAFVLVLLFNLNLFIIPAAYIVLGVMMVSGFRIIKYGPGTIAVVIAVCSLNAYLISSLM